VASEAGAMLSIASELILRAAGGSAFALHNAADTWEPWHYAAWMGIVLAGTEACYCAYMVAYALLHRHAVAK
jgi:hypothetical protein